MKNWVIIFFVFVMSIFDIYGQQKWNPGHYMLASDKTKRSEFIKGNFLGVQKKYSWFDIEKAKGVYDFSEIKGDLRFLQKNNRRLIIQLQTKAFDEGEYGGPLYLKNNEYGGGFYKTQRNNSYNPVFWNLKVEERINALYKALGKEFDDEPYLEAICLTETAPKIKEGDRQPGVLDYTDELYAKALIRQMKVLKDAFPKTVVIQFTNFPKSSLKEITNYQKEYCIGLGGPDINPFSKGLNDPKTGIYNYYDVLQGVVPLGTAVQHEDYDFKKTLSKGEVPGGKIPTVKELYEFGRDRLHLNYIFWLDRKGYIDQVIDMMRGFDFPKDKAGGLSNKKPLCLK